MSSFVFLLLHFKGESWFSKNWIPGAKEGITGKLFNSYLHFNPEESFPSEMGKPKRMGKFFEESASSPVQACLM